eukprot:354058-Chlamydomonas_euryale.AAC.9
MFRWRQPFLRTALACTPLEHPCDSLGTALGQPLCAHACDLLCPCLPTSCPSFPAFAALSPPSSAPCTRFSSFRRATGGLHPLGKFTWRRLEMQNMSHTHARTHCPGVHRRGGTALRQCVGRAGAGGVQRTRADAKRCNRRAGARGAALHTGVAVRSDWSFFCVFGGGRGPTEKRAEARGATLASGVDARGGGEVDRKRSGPRGAALSTQVWTCTRNAGDCLLGGQIGEVWPEGCGWVDDGRDQGICGQGMDLMVRW